MTVANGSKLISLQPVQGIRWIKNREGANDLTIIQQSQKGYIDKVIGCIENGKPLLIENLPDDIDAVLDPVVGKMTMRRGQNLVVKIGDNEVDYDRNFRLYLQTKLANPHYKPEINAQVQLVLCMLLRSLQRVCCCADVCTKYLVSTATHSDSRLDTRAFCADNVS
jgi:dynein heavy chain, axonemal